uniref:Retrotransposon gag domain-containing protein n=1 Tax=Cyprinus carpio carpio TaxID=630221 RepID=A0A9J8DBS4_CYPCA
MCDTIFCLHISNKPLLTGIPCCLSLQFVTEDQTNCMQRAVGLEEDPSQVSLPEQAQAGEPPRLHSPSMPASHSPMARPATYTGEAESCSGFLLQCSLYFEMQVHAFPTEHTKIAYLISLLSGPALQWAQSIWEANGPLTHFKDVFGLNTSALSIHDQLYRLRQGKWTVSEYALHFRTLAANCGWNETALITCFRQGLNPTIRHQVAVYDDVIGLENFIQRTIRISQRQTACALDQPAAHPLPPTPSITLPAPEPMQIDSYRFTAVERQRRIHNGLCLYSGSERHLLLQCPVRPPRPAVSTVQIPPIISPLSRTPVMIVTRSHSVLADALIDTGSSGNFISHELLKKLSLPRRRITKLVIHTILGKPLGRGQVCHQSPIVSLRIGCLHQEEILFLVLEGSTADIILGCPWMSEHSPQVNWTTGEIMQWGESCSLSCLLPVIKICRQKPSPDDSHSSSHLHLNSTSIESPESCHPTEIPP